MANTEDYVREKLGQALDALATGLGTLQERLRNAMLNIVVLEPEDFVDDESRSLFAELSYWITDTEAEADEGTIAATVTPLNDEEARRLAQIIVDLDSHYRPRWAFVGKSITDLAL